MKDVLIAIAIPGTLLLFSVLTAIFPAPAGPAGELPAMVGAAKMNEVNRHVSTYEDEEMRCLVIFYGEGPAVSCIQRTSPPKEAK